MDARANLTRSIRRRGLGQSIGLLLISPHQGVCSASITTAVRTAGRIIAVCSARGGSQVSRHPGLCQRKTHWSLKVMKRLEQRPRFLLSSVPASTLNQNKSRDDPCMSTCIYVVCLPRVCVCARLTKTQRRAACSVVILGLWIWKYVCLRVHLYLGTAELKLLDLTCKTLSAGQVYSPLVAAARERCIFNTSFNLLETMLMEPAATNKFLESQWVNLWFNELMTGTNTHVKKLP